MIVLFNGYGNHSNRLFQNLHFEAFCLENGIQYANPTFADMYEYYVSPVESKKENTAKFLRTRIGRYLIKYGLCKNVISFNNEDDNNAAMLLECSNQDCYVEGWSFRVHSLTAKYQDLFVEKYSLKDKYFINNSLYQKLTNIHRETTAIIGVHIRRDDYKSWMDGKYFFKDEVYKAYMLNLETKISKEYDKKCVFIVFSNESTACEDNTNTHVSNNDWYIDHLLMSKCDFLIGPPSTFTLWASYIGKTRFFHIKDGSGSIEIDKFKYCEG